VICENECYVLLLGAQRSTLSKPIHLFLPGLGDGLAGEPAPACWDSSSSVFSVACGSTLRCMELQGSATRSGSVIGHASHIQLVAAAPAGDLVAAL